MYLYLLILCTILCGGNGSFSKENIRPSVRVKRVIDPTIDGNRPVPISEVPYIVNILRSRIRHCVGTILSSQIVLTAGGCFRNRNASYIVLSGSPYANIGNHHRIADIIMYPHFKWEDLQDDLSILIIWPEIDFVHSASRIIELYNGHVTPDTYGIISGWGFNKIRGKIVSDPDELKSIEVPVISQAECSNIYRNLTHITNKHVCTFDINGRKCSTYGDFGAPLVINNRLAGVFAWSRQNEHRVNPDVFMNLSYPLYRNWILANIRLNHGFF